jgi:hypothetical protein
MLAVWSAQAQLITGFSPEFGQVGQQVVISGSGFFNSGVVTGVVFNTRWTTSFSVTADNQITAFVPSGATSGPIGVKKTGLPTVFSGASFTVIGPGPYVTGFSPAVGNPGDFPVIISGVQFTGASGVRFNGSNAAFAVTADTQIQAQVPAGASTGPITVFSALGTNTTTTNFFIPPAITNVSPASAKAGESVTVRGRNFTGATAVRFNGINAAFTVQDNTNLTATVPDTASRGPLSVSAPAGTAVTTNDFLIPPTITSFSPAVGTNGTQITVLGKTFVNVSGVSIGGVAAATFSTTNNGTELRVTVPNDARSGSITVVNASGPTVSVTNFFLPPRVDVFLPGSGLAGTEVAVSGINFLGASAVTFDGVPAAFGSVSNTGLRATLPAGALTGKIVVTAPAGSSASFFDFRVPPVISGFTPTEGLPGTLVTINGTNFSTNATVSFNGAGAAVTYLSIAQLRAVVPTNATTGPLRVATGGGTNTGGIFTVLTPEPPPMLSILRLTNGNVVISWPDSATGFTLEGATNLVSPPVISWSPVTNTTSVVGGNFAVTNAATNGVRFFRLRK